MLQRIILSFLLVFRIDVFGATNLFVEKFAVQDVDILGVVEKLREVYPFPICFEMETLDSEKQGITPQKCRELLGKKKSLTEREKFLLEIANSMTDHSSDNILD